MILNIILSAVSIVSATDVSQAGILWAQAYELEGGTLAVSKAAGYEVWVWAKSEGGVEVSIAGLRLEGAFSEGSRNKRAYEWFKIGKAKLPSGDVPVVLGEGIAALALSSVDGFDPRRSVKDMRVFDTPLGVDDARADRAHHTDTVFTMPHFQSVEAWESFAENLRRRILVSSGLWPLPERSPLNAFVSGRITHDDYSVEKVRFEATPGFYVTGNLYTPAGEGPFPGVLCPHGHWGEGRLENSETGSVAGRCITLARMGMVAFSVDMLGYNDSCQFEHRWSHEHEKLWGIHPFALQLWSNIRAIDFLQSLSHVDSERIGCTGASGGGTQTFALMAVDPRVKVAAPVNMISSTMQGGCVCENAPILRLENSNMEIGALMAPRPLLMVSATGDWTRETPRTEYPAIRSIYELYDATARVRNVHVDAGHNYNQRSREAMYRFFGRWLLEDGDRWDQFTEPPFEVETADALRLFPDRVLPKGSATSEAIIANTLTRARANLQTSLPSTAGDLSAYQETFRPALADVLGAEIPEPNELTLERFGMEERDGYVIERWTAGRRDVGDRIPMLLYRSRGDEVQDSVVIAHGEGKAALADWVNGGPGPLVKELMSRGKAVLVVDAFLLGEHHSPFERRTRRKIGAFHDTFNPTDTACRVQDLLTSIAFLRARRDLSSKVDLIGLGEGGMWALLASALDEEVGATVVDANGFDFGRDEAWVSTYYVPCIRGIGDVLCATALIAPRSLAVMNTAGRFDGARAESIFEAAQSGDLRVAQELFSIPEIMKALGLGE